MTLTSDLPVSLAPVDQLLPLLVGVKRSGKGYTARCPAHEDKTASLSINASDDGRVLVHCFAGCSVGEICTAIGLSVSDLFPPRSSDLSPEGQKQLRQNAKFALWAAALGVIVMESAIVLCAASDVCKGIPITAADLERVSLACQRLDAARVVLA